MKKTLSLYAFAAATCLSPAAGASVGAQPPIRNIHTFPKNTFIENIAVRSNGSLLVTSMSVPTLFTINPSLSDPDASVLPTFPNATGISGIAETAPDRLRPCDRHLGPGQHPYSPFSSGSALSRPPNSTILNGLAPHPSKRNLLLAADSARGALWRVDLATGAHAVVLESDLLKPTGTAPGTHLGVNGLRAGTDGYVYFTNSAQGFLGRVKVDQNGEGVVYDDFALDFASLSSSSSSSSKEAVAGAAEQAIWIASHPSYAVRVGLGDGEQGLMNDTAKLLNPTSAEFGRGGEGQRRTLYVTNGGEFVGDDLVNEGVVPYHLGRRLSYLTVDLAGVRQCDR
ncbi:hypothetical protein C7999DRAFT_32040 [Corynascus novoguineensis]|uniref:Uncharacterized protein n=1 Tax=Corynascus novoguineensis TaxID=1126955 RepID=A0AAN7CV65_9PEZI|nr:hypothetical protein C7999DRAFT_32040 [Corynascus novoguineensis]